MRYCKQRNSFECGPIAILNALKWSGARATLKDLADIRKNSGTDKLGTSERLFRKELKSKGKGYFKVTAFTDKQPDISFFLRELWKDRCAIIVAHKDCIDPKDSHYSLWIGRTDSYIKAVNYDHVSTERRLSIQNIPMTDEIYLLEREI